MKAAAFFDLDRTLLEGASWPILASKLRETGVLSDREIPALEGLFGLFRAFGENYLVMAATKRAVSRTRGWNIDDVDEAAQRAVPELLAELQPFARSVIDGHRAAGRPVVLATTTPHRLVAPFAEALGLDGVVATRYGIVDGCFDGTFDGPFTWSRGKLDAVRSWAEENKVDLRRSYAYSDSFFDAPLLDAVGHPTAVNPDPRLRALALVRGWPTRWLDKPEGVPKFAGVELQRLLRPYVHEALIPNARFDITGIENLPAAGGAIVVANHRSYFDPMALSLTLAKANRDARFLGKKEVFDAPVIGAIATAMGGIRVDRGSGSDEPLAKAVEALQAGELVAVMPQGTIPRGPAFFDPKLNGRFGAARLAALAGVPIYPIGLWGTERVWPRASRLPRLDLADPPTISIRIGQAVDLGGTDMAADTNAIMAAIVDLLPPEARKRRKPNAEELALTYPPGYKGDPTSESERRPGSD